MRAMPAEEAFPALAAEEQERFVDSIGCNGTWRSDTPTKVSG